MPRLLLRRLLLAAPALPPSPGHPAAALAHAGRCCHMLLLCASAACRHRCAEPVRTAPPCTPAECQPQAEDTRDGVKVTVKASRSRRLGGGGAAGNACMLCSPGISCSHISRGCHPQATHACAGHRQPGAARLRGHRRQRAAAERGGGGDARPGERRHRARVLHSSVPCTPLLAPSVCTSILGPRTRRPARPGAPAAWHSAGGSEALGLRPGRDAESMPSLLTHDGRPARP